MKLLCKLNQLMLDRGLSQTEVIRRSGLAPRTLRELQKSTFDRVDKRTIVKLMDVLDLRDLSELLYIEE